MIEDTFDRDVVRSFKKFIERVVATADAQNPSGLSPLGDAISEFLGANASTLARQRARSLGTMPQRSQLLPRA